MKSCTDGIRVPDTKQKKNHQASNTLTCFQNFIGNVREIPSLWHTLLLGPHLFCLVLRVASCLQLCASCYHITSKQPCLQRNAYWGVILKLQGSTLHVFLSLLFSDSKVVLPWAESGHLPFDHLLPCSAKAENEWSCISLHLIWLHCTERDNLPLLLEVHGH